jgi:hypothetical protein
VLVALLVPLRGPLCDAVHLVLPAGTAAATVATLVSLGPLAFALGRQLGGCLGDGLTPVLLGISAGELLVFAGATGWLPSWAMGAVVAAGLAALREAGKPRHEEPLTGDEAPIGLLVGAILVLWVDALARIVPGYTTPSAWAGNDALLAMLVLGALVAWPASLLVPRTARRARRALAGAGALLLAVALWAAISELALYLDQGRAVSLSRTLHERASRLGAGSEWWLWLATLAGMRAAAAGLMLGALGARSLGAAAIGGGLTVLGVTWLPADPTLLPAAELLAATGLAVAAAPVAWFGRRGLLLLPVVGVPFLLLPEHARPRFDEIRRRGEFGVQAFERTALGDVVLYATPDIDSLAVEGRAAASTSCSCERVALTLSSDGELVESVDERRDLEHPCYGLRVAGVPLHAGHGPLGDAGSVGRLLRVFGPRGRWLASGVGAELVAADLHVAGLLEEGFVATPLPMGEQAARTLLDALGNRKWSPARIQEPLQAALEPDHADLDGIVVPPEHAAWDSAAFHASREHLARLARRLRPGGRCLLYLDTSGLDASALDARLAAFGAVFGARSAAFVEPRELDAPFILAVGWVDEAGQPESMELMSRLAGLESSPLRTRLRAPDDLAALLLRDGPGMQAGAGRGSPANRARPAPPGRWSDKGWAAVAAVADPSARLDGVVRGAADRPGADQDVLAGLALHSTYQFQLRDLNDTTFFLPQDVDWVAFDAEVERYIEAAARERDDPLLQLAVAALLEPLAMAGDYGRFARVYEACGAREMDSVRLALLEAWVQRRSLETEASEKALERARRLAAGEGY